MMRVITLNGTPWERGCQYGESLNSEILSMVKLLAGMEDPFSDERFKSYIHELIHNTGFLKTVEIWTPDILEELRGMSETTEIPFDFLFCMQLLDETDWYFKQKMFYMTKPSNDTECSALGVFGQQSHPTILAQNSDFGYILQGKEILLHIYEPKSGLEMYQVSFPGLIGVIGINNRGIGLCMNAMSGQLRKSDHGLGTLFMAHGILNQSSFNAGVKFLQNAPHASGESYMIGCFRNIMNFEASSYKVVRTIPSDDSHLVYHTNHALVNDDRDDDFLEALKKSSPDGARFVEEGLKDSTDRLNSIKNRLSQATRPFNVEIVKSILSAHDSDYPVCKHKTLGREGMTNFSLIMELTETIENTRIHIAPGPPCENEYQVFSFK